jgi:hypothetical protein
MTGNLTNTANRVLFGASVLLTGLAVWDRVIHAFGYTILRGYAPSRLLDLAGLGLLFVIALELREIKEQMRRA